MTETPDETNYPWIHSDLAPLAVPLESLVLDPRNARKHSEENIRAVEASLKQFGQLKPLIANKESREIEAGNCTYMAAHRLGWSHIAVVWVRHDPAAHRGFSLADNRTAELADWDDEVLESLLLEVEGESPDLYADLLLAELRQAKEKESADAGDEELPPAEWKIVVDCKSEEKQQELYERLRAEGFDIRLLTL